MRPFEPAGSRNRQPFERRVVAHGVRRLAVGDLPDDLPLAEIDRRDASPWRFDERQPLDREPAAAALALAVAVVRAPARPPPARPAPPGCDRRAGRRRSGGAGADAVPWMYSMSDRSGSWMSPRAVTCVKE